jgi:rhodanese-related sulfurtransferase
MHTATAYTERPVADVVSILGHDGQLVDVREPNEVAAGTIDGAINIALATLPDRMHELDPNRTVALLCRSGARSATAARFLAANGFTDVVNLAGGMLAYPHG